MYIYKETLKMPDHAEKILVSLKKEMEELQEKLFQTQSQLFVLANRAKRITGMIHSLMATETDTINTLAKFDEVDKIIENNDQFE